MKKKRKEINYCADCRKPLSEEEGEASFNKGNFVSNPLCFDCMNKLAHHAITGE